MKTTLLLVSLCGGCAALAAEPEARQWTAPNKVTVSYRWSAPAAPEPDKTYPLVLFLHGAGERGNDNKAQLKHGVTAILDGAVRLGEPCFLIAPQCPPKEWWGSLDRDPKLSAAAPAPPSPLLDALLALVTDSVAHHPIDPKRIYVTGLSMGGFGTWEILSRAPKRFAAAIPICGGGNPGRVAAYREVPIWAFHGEADPVVPVSATRDMISALEKAGGTPKATYYPGVGHDSWTQTYADPEVIKWLFEQRAK